MVKKNENGTIEIDLLAMGEFLWDHVLAIILAGAICAGLAFGYTVCFVDPQYEAKASMYVNNSSFSLGSSNFSISTSELSAGSSLVDVYIYILESRTTLEDVIKKANLPYSYEELLENQIVTTEKVDNTAAFEVVATSKDPAEAELIANTIAEILPDRIAEIVDGASVRIVDYAIIPSHRSSPSYTKNAAIGALLGILISCIVLILLEIKRESAFQVISSVEELKKKYPDIPVLALIPDMRYANKKGYYSSYYYGGASSGGQKRAG